jgi:hypothetical protein
MHGAMFFNHFWFTAPFKTKKFAASYLAFLKIAIFGTLSSENTKKSVNSTFGTPVGNHWHRVLIIPNQN